MSFLFRRIANRIQPVTLEAAAVETRVISPAIEVAARPVVALPDAFESIINVVNGDRTLEWKRVTGAPCAHLPTIEFTLEKARLKGSYLAAGRFVQQFRSQHPIDAGAGEMVRLDEAVLSSNILSGREFGHWVRDALVTEMHGINEGLPAVGIARELWPHEPDFRAMSGLSCAYLPDAQIGRLKLLDDRGHNASWRARFLALRARLRDAAAELPGESAGSHVFLTRGAHGRVREPTNVGDLQAVLEAAGFRTVVPTALSVQEIGLALRDARVVVSAEGSQLNHLHFFAPDAMTVMTLQDPRRFYAYHKGPADFYDAIFGYVVGRPDPAEPARFRIEPDDLLATLDLAETAATRR